MHGLYVHLVHTGTTNKPLFLSDIYPTTDGHTAFRRAGLDATNGELNLYTTPIALSLNNTGGGDPHENMAPFLAVNFIIKT